MKIVLVACWSWAIQVSGQPESQDFPQLRRYSNESTSPELQDNIQNNDFKMKQIMSVVQLYFKHRHLENLNVYMCDTSDSLRLYKYLLRNNFMVHIKSEMIPEIHHYDVQGHFVDLTCKKIRDEFAKVGGERGIWLLYDEATDTRSLAGLRLDSDVVLATRDGMLWDASAHDGTVRVVEAGSWQPFDVRIPDRRDRFDLKGKVLRSVFMELEMNFTGENRVELITDNTFHPYTEMNHRYTYTLFNDLAHFYNFQIETLNANTWGLPVGNGSFTGMIGLIQRGEADVGISACEMRDERFAVATFLPPLQRIRFICVFLEEKSLGTYKALFVPFSPNVWLCVFCTIVFAGVLFGLMNDGEHTQGIVLVIGILAQQGLSVDGDRLPVRIYNLCLLLLGLILYSYYNAAIMNGLLSPSPVTIHNLYELEKSPLRINIANIPYLNFAYNQKKYVPKELLEKVQRHPNWLVEVTDGLNIIREDRFGLVSDEITLYPYIEETYSDDGKCSLREIETYKPFPLSMPLPKKSPYREMLTQGVTRIQENGMAIHERKRWYPEKPHCLGSTIFTHVSLEAVSVALICLGVGIISSLLIFVLELVVKKKEYE